MLSPVAAKITRGLLAGTVLFTLWALFNWPALSHVWWVEDDLYVALGTPESVSFALSSIQQGRIFAVLWFLGAYVLMSHNMTFAFIVLHLVQGMLHVLAVLFAGALLARFTRSRLAFATILPFLLWPFGNEATTWISAAVYPMAALLSLSGTLLLIGKDSVSFSRKLAGMLLIILSPFANQSACLAGLVLYCMVLAISRSDREHRSLLLRTSPYLLIAYAMGTIANTAFPILLGDSRVAALTMTNALVQVIPQLALSAQYLFRSPDLYPAWFVTFQTAIFVLALVAVFPLSAGQSIRGKIIGGIAVVLLGFAIALLLRIPSIILGMFWVSGRTMYLDPLLFSFALCLILQSRLRYMINTITVALLLIVITGAYYPISVANAREHVTVFENDLKTLRHLEVVAQAEKTDQLLIAYLPYGQPSDNPYSIRYYNFGDIHHTVFRTRLYSIPFVELFSKQLHLIRDPELIKHCVESCPKAEQPRRWIGILEQPVRALCFCP